MYRAIADVVAKVGIGFVFQVEHYVPELVLVLLLRIPEMPIEPCAHVPQRQVENEYDALACLIVYHPLFAGQQTFYHSHLQQDVS